VRGGRQPWKSERAQELIAAHRAALDAALPILHALQAEFGYVDDAALPLIAAALNLSRAELYGILTFYRDFRRAPPGRRVLKLCRAEACQAMGGEALAADALAHWHIAWGGTTAEGGLTVEPVYCLGLCAVAPAGMLDGAPLGRLDTPRLAALLDEAAP
jgi:formate dehydrogenase subunit gamma